jgi:bacillopeptidase F
VIYRINQKLIFLMILFCFLAGSVSSGILSENLERIYYDTNDSLVTVVIFLENDSKTFDLTKTTSIRKSRKTKIKETLEYLNSNYSQYEDGLYDFLSDYNQKLIHRHNIISAYTIELNSSLLSKLISLPGVNKIVENANLIIDSPVKSSLAPNFSSSNISYELELLGVPTLWQKGLKGKGRLVCSFDTGVDYEHPALSDKWRGNTTDYKTAWFSKSSTTGVPADLTGHGTHTMGLMVGSADADSFGVAPEAEWISAGIIDQGRDLSVTISDILEGFEWALNPDGDITTTDDVPDVILNSWGIPSGLFEPCDNTFWEAIDILEAAGIVTIFACGNEGPDPMTIRSPADRASTPLSSFSVGAVDFNKEIAEFSSRGPSSCDNTTIKPDVVAYGVSIRSSDVGGGYSSMTGTSMAAPFVAGAVALIRQYNPDATVEEIKNAFIMSAEDLGSVGKDNAFGSGLVNFSNILDYIPAPIESEFVIAEKIILDNKQIAPGESISMNLVLQNSNGTIENVTGEIIQDDNQAVTILNSYSDFYFGAGNTEASNMIPFEFTVSSFLNEGDQISFTLILVDDKFNSDTLSFSLDVVSSNSQKAELYQNYPNPFNPATTISFNLPQAGDVKLEIYNLVGQKIETLHHGYLGEGLHEFPWVATFSRSSSIASGIYFYKLTVGQFTTTRKMALLK